MACLHVAKTYSCTTHDSGCANIGCTVMEYKEKNLFQHASTSKCSIICCRRDNRGLASGRGLAVMGGLFGPRESLASPPPPTPLPLSRTRRAPDHWPPAGCWPGTPLIDNSFPPPSPPVHWVAGEEGARGRAGAGRAGDEQSSGAARRERPPCCLNTVSQQGSPNRPPGPLALDLLSSWPLSSVASLLQTSSTKASARLASV